MGRHSKDVARSYRGRHRAPTQTGRYVARAAATGTLAAAPLGMIASPALAAETTASFAPVASVSASGGFDHDAIARCESGGNASAQNPSSSASGLYQFIDSTWKAYGGSTARAKDASVAEQRRVAERAFAAEGYTPWNASKSCWSGKIGSSSSLKVTGEKRSTQSETKSKTKSQSNSKTEVKSQSKSKTEVKSEKVAKKASPKKVKAVPKSNGTHKVRAGETLSEITMTLTGKSDWSKMYDANRDVIGGNPNLIVPGQVLKVVR